MPELTIAVCNEHTEVARIDDAMAVLAGGKIQLEGAPIELMHTLQGRVWTRTIDKAELFSYMRDHLAPHKTPKQWFEVDAFPLTGSGKIQKYKLRDQWVAGDVSEL